MKDPRNDARFKQLPHDKQVRALLEAILENQIQASKPKDEPQRTLTMNRAKNA